MSPGRSTVRGMSVAQESQWLEGGEQTPNSLVYMLPESGYDGASRMWATEPRYLLKQYSGCFCNNSGMKLQSVNFE